MNNKMELISKKTLESLQAWVTLGHYGAGVIRHRRPILQTGLLLNSVIITGFRSKRKMGCSKPEKSSRIETQQRNESILNS